MILIGVPLLSELIFLGFLLNSLDHAEVEAQRARHAKTLQEAMTDVLKKPVIASTLLASYGYSKASEFEVRFDETLASIPNLFKRLGQLVSDNPAQLEKLNELQSTVDQLVSMLHQIRRGMNDNNLSLVGSRELRHKINKLLERANVLSTKILDMEAESIDLTVDTEKDARTRLRAGIISGIALSILLAVLLAIIFYQSTQKRLQLLLENTKSLSKQQPLQNKLAGKDELAHLDRVFHETADALMEAIHKKQAIIDNAVEVICSISWNGTFTAVSSAATVHWGFLPTELVGTNWLTLIQDDHRPSTIENFEKARESRKTVHFENNIVRKDGTLASMKWAAQSSAEEQEIFCVVHDVTAEKEIERLKRDFISMVTHDLRTPLTSVRLFLELLQEGLYGELPASGQSKARKVEENVNRLIELVNDLLSIEKLAAGEMPLEYKQTSFQTTLARTLEATSYLVEKHGTVLACSNEEIEFVADEDQIVQVLVNLVSNAVKFSPPQGKVIIEGLTQGDDLVVRVIDQGCGISKQFQETIFQRFKQVGKRSTTHGTGLGLPISKSIIELHGGQIGIISEGASGSTFWFTIPLFHTAKTQPAATLTDHDKGS